VIPACEFYGLGLIPWSPLAGGLLAGAPKDKVGRRTEEDRQKDFVKYGSQLKRYEAFCAKIGEDPANVALAWLLHQPAVTAPIIGPRTMEQLTGAMRVLDIKFTPAQLAALDKIWPGPGGPAPEAYAW